MNEIRPNSGLILPQSLTAWDRRKFLTRSLMGAGAVAAAGVLAACGGGTSPSAQDAGPARRGGTLRFGGSGGGTSDTLDAHNPLTNTDNARVPMLYDPLVRLNNEAQVEMVMAQSITPNADATEWTIKIPAGITTHQGKPFVADDVLFSFQRMFDNKFPGSVALGPLDLKASKAVDPTTVLLKFSTPFSILPEALSLYFINMVPRGYDPKNPDGTGPFKYKSFTPGTESTFVRNDNYWQSGLPYLDAIVTTNIADETSQISGLQSGQLDLVNFLSAPSVAALRGGGFKVTISKTGSWGPFTMRIDQKPFTDPRVRQAMRLVVDRPQMLNQVFGGLGTIGNDVIGIVDPIYDQALPQRVQDIAQAKSLLAAAGFPDLSVDLVTTVNAPGGIQAAQVFATQAAAAGIKVNINQQNSTDYFANSYLKTTFSQDYWPTQPYLVAVSQALTHTPAAPFNATFQNDPNYDALYAQAVATLDKGKQADLAHQMQKIEYDNGGNIIPYFFPVIDAAAQKVQGVKETKNGLSPGGFDWKHFWMSA